MGAWAPAVLRISAHRHDELRWLAAAWQVSERCGAALAPVVDGLASALRAQATHARAVHAELAGVRTSARLLALVPLVGLLMAVALGARPVGFLLGSDAGRVCLAAGLMLEWAGLRWSGSIADRARRAG
jgi:tight adherence protein B